VVTELLRRGKAPATIGKAAQLVRGIFEEAVQERVIPRSPWINIKLPTIDRIEARFLTVEQVECLADAIHGRYRTLVRTLAFTGLRFGEAAALRVEDIDPLRRKISVTRTIVDTGVISFGPPKTRAGRRIVGVPPSLAEDLRREVRWEGPVSS